MSRPRTKNSPNQLAAIRDERGLRSSYVAEKLGVAIETLSRWESIGLQKPSKASINSLSHFYGLPVSTIEEAIAKIGRASCRERVFSSV